MTIFCLGFGQKIDQLASSNRFYKLKFQMALPMLYRKCMTHKQHAMTLTRPWSNDHSFKSHLREIVASLKRMVEVPTGYQDERGFHFGTVPAKDKIQWPPA